ncbi:uncharacterized protein OCT59_000484 [Rhizophagus irregularis]|uniref:uncharacterized protein n=1 Tax=Rhizophagus irregularis TaxID=588596 RepID=UPI003317F083|nr:hypothetical protein OCT59_000484 [Rhizophagus irregularis]
MSYRICKECGKENTEVDWCKESLKSLNNSENVTSEFINEITMHFKRCLDANPINRPEAVEIRDILWQWWIGDEELQKQFKQIEESEKINTSLPASSIPLTSLSYETHSEAVYTMKNFQNLYKLIFLN